METDKGNPLQN
jgi:hypothetical protein